MPSQRRDQLHTRAQPVPCRTVLPVEPDVPSPDDVVDAWQDALRAAELAQRLATEARDAFERSLPLEPPSETLTELAARMAAAAAGASVQGFRFMDESQEDDRCR
jgi:hypothetical protein